MTLATPSVYIGTEAMAGHALADVPVLAGLTFNYGTDSQMDFDEPATASAQLLVRTPSTLDFLTVGAPFGVLIDGATVFAGRIATLKATRDKRKKDALLISLTATDTLADLAAYRTTVDWHVEGQTAYTFSAADRRAQLAAAMPAGWTLDGPTPLDWTRARPQRWQSEPLLPLLDMHLRSTVARRHCTSTFVPGAGLAPRITIAPERAKNAPSETLATRAGGAWYMSTGAPANTAFVQLDSKHVAGDVEWEKNPGDTVTDVQLEMTGLLWGYDQDAQAVIPGPTSVRGTGFGTESPIENNAGNPGIDVPAIRAMQAKYGYHQAEFTIDSLGGGTNSGDPHLGMLVTYWIDADTQWRPTSVEIPDSRKLADATVLGMLDVAKRYNAYLTLSNMPANNPAGGSRVRAYITGADVQWTGKKWVLDLTLGRVPRPSAAAGNLTFNSIRTHANPAISGGTAETVGTEITFADFAYIGA